MRTPFLLLLLPLAACNTWPDPVGGGMAEVAKPVVRQNAPEVVRHLDCSLQSLAALTQVADGRVTGQIVTLQTVAARAQREVYGRLPKDADRTLNILDREVAALGSALQIATVSARHCTA